MDFSEQIKRISGATHSIALNLSSINSDGLTISEARGLGQTAIKDIQVVGDYATTLSELMEIERKMPDA